MDSIWAIVFMGVVFILIGLGFIVYDIYAKRSAKKPSSKRA